MKKFQFFVLMFCLLFSLSNVKAEKMTVLKDVTSGTVVKNVHSDDGKHCRDVSFTYNISDVKRIASYRTDVTVGNYSMVYYQLGAFSESTGKYCREMEVRFDDEEPVESTITNTFSGVGFFMDFDNNYCSEDCYCTISGCPVFSSYEACEKYLKTGEYDEDEIISPNGIDEYGNPEKDVVFDKNVPCPQNMRVTLQTSNTSALSTFTNFSNINFAWDNLDECDLENTFIEIQGKFDSFGYYKNGIDHIAKKKTNYNDDSADWITPCSSTFHFKTSNGKYTWYGDSKFGSQYDSQLGLQNNYYLYDYFTSRCGVNFYALDYYINKGSVRIRNCMYIDGKMHVSSWVTKLDLNGSNGSNVITDETGNPTTVTDNEGNPSDQDYEQNSDSYDSSSASSSNESFFSWLARQVDGLNRFFASVKKSFATATDAGTSFIAMFKAYNTWLPETFFTMLVTGIGIVILLRILGR